MGEQVSARFHGGVAQLGEHLPCKQGVKSSNLSISTASPTYALRELRSLSRVQARYKIKHSQPLIKAGF